ncbi:MAG TPA: carboxypeptidase-like regulatory domain-containing protein [Candidatus Hydrogenedens sp.]|nr:carboxypeptidase-like regulatory domain-containing protein [Candidatus Hydrogenedens sp.]
MLYSLYKDKTSFYNLFRFITFLFIATSSFYVFSDNCSVKGRIVDSNSTPVVNAEVYCEQGLLEPLIQTHANTNGEFEFLNLKEGPTGIFATTEGKAWSGIHLNLPSGEHVENFDIVLTSSTRITGLVVSLDEKGKEKPVSGAEVDRFAILGAEKIAIPCSKLVSFGYARVVSNNEGRFLLNKVPQGQSISIKFVHPEFAITTVEYAAADTEVKVKLSKGCVVLGSVYTMQNGNNAKVANAELTIKNTQPPYESVCIKTNSNGEFTIRLNPGVYLCKAETEQLLSAGWEVKQIVNPSGEHLQIEVLPAVYISGTILDAVSGNPVPGCKISIEQGGRKSFVLTTGSKGKFRGKVVHGQALVKFEAIPGYSMPQPSQLRVLVSGKDEIVLPGVWVKKLNSLQVRLVLPNQQKLTAKNGVVCLLNPPQLGWYIGDIRNPISVNITTSPSSGKIVGYAEVPDENAGNIFIVDSKDLGKVCEVNLHQLGKVLGKVTDKAGKPITNVILSCVLLEKDTRQESTLWQVLLANDGSFSWNSIVPLENLIFRLYSEDGSVIWQSQEMQFLESEEKIFGNIVINSPKISGGQARETFVCEKFKYSCAQKIDIEKLCKGPAILIFANEAEIPFVQDVLVNIKRFWSDNMQVGIITDKEINCEGIDIPVLIGKCPSLATTYLLDDNGRLICETFGLPVLKNSVTTEKHD